MGIDTAGEMGQPREMPNDLELRELGKGRRRSPEKLFGDPSRHRVGIDPGG
jgi:hypothetical protein